MSRSRDLMAGLAVAVVAAYVFTGCGEGSQEAAPVEPELTRVSSLSALTAPLCPVAEESSVRAEILPRGGTVSLHGHSVYFPPGAVREPVEVKLTVPASQYVEVDIQVNGQEHYRLARPVLATLSYERCDAEALRGRFAVWHVDGRSHRLLERMGSLDDEANRSVSFVTNHFSRYVVISN